MECFYINTDAAKERRSFLQGNFEQHKSRGWFLNRVAAIDSQQLASQPAQGRIRDTEKGCFLSHRRAIEASLEAPGHALITEDDVMFGPSSCARIDGAIAANPDTDWDLLFTDVIIPHPPLMAELLRMRRGLGASGGQMLLNANDLVYCGATAYIVNHRFKARLLQLLTVDSLDFPYDLFLRGIIVQGFVRASVIFPFATSLSDFGDKSQIQFGEKSDMVWNAFRRLIWADRDLDQVAANLHAFGEDLTGPVTDLESALFACIVGSAPSTAVLQEKS